MTFKVDDGEQVNHLSNGANATVNVSLASDHLPVITSSAETAVVMAVPTGNSVVNGGFETGDLSGWSDRMADNSPLLRTAVNGDLVQSGAYSLETGSGIFSDLLHPVATFAGVQYTVSFDLADSFPGAPADPSGIATLPNFDSFSAAWNFTDALFTRVDDHLSGFTHYSFDVVGGAGLSFLEFQSWNIQNLQQHFWYLDNVSVVASGVTANGTIGFTDADTADTHTASFAADGSGYLGTFSLDPAVNETNGSGSIGWHFAVSNDDLVALGATSQTQTYTVTVHDGFAGGDASEDVAVTLVGPGLEHPILMSDFGASFLALAPVLDPVGGERDDHLRGTHRLRRPRLPRR